MQLSKMEVLETKIKIKREKLWITLDNKNYMKFKKDTTRKKRVERTMKELWVSYDDLKN